MEKDQIFILKDRGIVYISGEDAKKFLQNIITNDIKKSYLYWYQMKEIVVPIITKITNKKIKNLIKN